MDPADRIIDYAPAGAPRSSFLSTHLSTKWLYWTLAIVLAFVLWVSWPGPLELGRKFLAERECVNYEAPAGQVVYDSDPARAQAFFSQKGYLIDSKGAAIYTPKCWSRTGLQTGDILLFLHSMQSKNGARLVGVELQGNQSEFVLCTTLYECHGLTISRPYNNTFHTFPIGSQESSSLRFYAGQLDPSDESRFSIRYTLDGKDGTIVGRLSERGDSVRFEFPAIAEVR
jgi:hypothetical protein